jgi:hypothetical protein
VQSALARTKAPLVRGESHALGQQSTHAKTTQATANAKAKKTAKKKRVPIRKPLHDEPVRPVIPTPPPQRPDTPGEGRVNPRG